MIKKLLLLTLLSYITLQADCSSYYILGAKQQSYKNITNTKNAIVFNYENDNWSASDPLPELSLSDDKCKKNGFILVNNDEISYKTKTYTKDHYELKKGWNYLPSHKDGIDVKQTFKANQNVEFVYVYDKFSQAWAGYSANEKLNKKIANTRILYLKDIEPNIGFYVYAKRATKVKIQSTLMSESCMKKAVSPEFAVLTDSGMDEIYTDNKNKTMSVKSRYKTHYKIGIYDDTRVSLIYPKINTNLKNEFKYGPAKPKIQLLYAKEYEGKKFYIYDYKEKKCFQGLFPSMKIPPFATLKEI